MGKQVRKVMPWTAMVESHLVTGHVVHRIYRWSTYFSHPTMRPGSPFKYRGSATPYVGMISTADVLKYKVPVPFAFVPSNPKYDPKINKTEKNFASKTIFVAKEASFHNRAERKMQINNFNKCVRNNQIEECVYYLNYLNINCK